MNHPIEIIPFEEAATFRMDLEGLAPAEAAHLRRQLRVGREGKEALILGIRREGRLVACNAFIPHPFLLDGQPLTAWQSCWSLTLPEERGKGMFQALIEAAKERLCHEQNGLIFGFPNAASRPIFTGPLGFSDWPLCRVYVPRPGFRLAFRPRQKPHRGGPVLSPDMKALRRYLSSDPLVRVFEKGEEHLVGKMVRKGKRRVLIGGLITAQGPKSLRSMIGHALKETRARFFYTRLTTNDPLTRYFRIRRKAGEDAIIVYGKDLPADMVLRFGEGIADYF